MEQNIINCKDLFLKERYIYLLLKTTSSIADHKQTILYYENMEPHLSQLLLFRIGRGVSMQELFTTLVIMPVHFMNSVRYLINLNPKEQKQDIV